MTRMRSNTFVTLLIRAGVPDFGARPAWGESNHGITFSNLLADLIRLSLPNYEPKRKKTLVSYFSRFIQGEKINSPKYLPFDRADCRNGLSDRLQNDCEAVFREMDNICHTYLDLSDYSLRLLVGGIVETILDDDTFDGEFDIGNKKVTKTELDSATTFVLQPFLSSVWSVILAKHPNTTEGKDTYMNWTENAGFNTTRKITTSIGEEKAKKITVTTDIPKTEQVATVTNENELTLEADVMKDYINFESTEKESGKTDKRQQTVMESAGQTYNQQAEKIIIQNAETIVNDNSTTHVTQNAKEIFNIDHVDTISI